MKYLLILIILIPLKTISCSAFFSDGQTKYFAKNFDWGSGQGYIIKNVSGQKKFAYGLRGLNQANWTSKYGSTTFNQIGKEFPYGGMNEKGLVVEQLWMAESMYQDNKNQTLSELEWIQYQLDNYSTIDEVILHINNLTIKPIVTIHYFIADRNGNSAVIDFVEGSTIVNKKQGLNQVITNETLINSVKYFELNKTKIDKDSRTHFDRYCQIKNSLSNTEIENPNQAFEILNNSSENKVNYKTYWTIVYDLSNLRIYFKSFDNINVKEFILSEINFDPNSMLEASKINQDYFKLENYTFETNKTLFTTSIKMMNLKMDEELGAIHQMTPNQNRIDKIYQNNYIDLTIIFYSKSAKGNIYFTLMNGEESFNKRRGIKSGLLPIQKTENKKIIYGVPKGEFALACYQDTNLDKKIDTKIFGIPKNYGFSGNKRGFFGTPPKYKDAKIDFITDTEIIIKIK
jgi:choloylglycine hydrolase